MLISSVYNFILGQMEYPKYSLQLFGTYSNGYFIFFMNVKYLIQIMFVTFVLVKKIFSILFLFVYLTTTAGISVQMHYCHGFVSNINLGYSEEDPCVCTDKKDMHCCADEFKYIKLDEKHVVKNLVKDFSIASYNFITVDFKEIFQKSIIEKQTFAQFAQPPPNNISKQVLLSVFII